METAIEDPAELGLQIVDIDYLAPCCEICGMTLGPDVQTWWIEHEGACEGEWPRFHPDCYDDVFAKTMRKGGDFPDIFEYT